MAHLLKLRYHFLGLIFFLHWYCILEGSLLIILFMGSITSFFTYLMMCYILLFEHNWNFDPIFLNDSRHIFISSLIIFQLVQKWGCEFHIFLCEDVMWARYRQLYWICMCAMVLMRGKFIRFWNCVDQIFWDAFYNFTTVGKDDDTRPLRF